MITNGNVSNQIELERSTRQGCPLSPLLFNLAIEPLAISIRNQSNLSGIMMGNQEHRISLYADDVILFLSKLSISILTILQLIKEFGIISGYCINDIKSSIMFLNKEERRYPPIKSPLSNTNEGFTYLGIKITPYINTIAKTNYDPLVSGVKELLEKC